VLNVHMMYTKDVLNKLNSWKTNIMSICNFVKMKYTNQILLRKNMRYKKRAMKNLLNRFKI